MDTIWDLYLQRLKRYRQKGNKDWQNKRPNICIVFTSPGDWQTTTQSLYLNKNVRHSQQVCRGPWSLYPANCPQSQLQGISHQFWRSQYSSGRLGHRLRYYMWAKGNKKVKILSVKKNKERQFFHNSWIASRFLRFWYLVWTGGHH